MRVSAETLNLVIENVHDTVIRPCSQVSDVFQDKIVGITCYKHKFGVFEKGKNGRIRFSMFPTWEIGFGCHVTFDFEGH